MKSASTSSTEITPSRHRSFLSFFLIVIVVVVLAILARLDAPPQVLLIPSETAFLAIPAAQVSTITPALLPLSEIDPPSDIFIITEVSSNTGSIPIAQFVFPTQAAPPRSAWRPPLYPIPWAISPHDHFFFSRPILADEVNWATGNYRYGGVFFENIVHSGIDIAAERGTPVIAAGSGKVIWAGYGLYSGIPANNNDPYGLAVVILHDFGYLDQSLYTLYGHMSRIDVVRGQIVQTGDLLGQVGDTGFTTGPHLHFEVRLGRNNFFATYNPELWMAPPVGWGVLAGRLTNTNRESLLTSHTIIVRNLDTGKIWNVDSYDFSGGINMDPYYKENLVIGDLPEGNYRLETNYLGVSYNIELVLQPGRVNYFSLSGRGGFSLAPPEEPEPSFSPPEEISSNP